MYVTILKRLLKPLQRGFSFPQPCKHEGHAVWRDIAFCLSLPQNNLVKVPQARLLVFQHGLRVSDRHSKIGAAKIFHHSECHTDHTSFAVN